MNAIEIARDFIGGGWQPVPLKTKSKIPYHPSWQNRNFQPADFRPGDNIGIRLGRPSGGLVDIDLDCSEAVELAREFLPATEAIFGRPGKPQSHWLYVCDGEPSKTRRWQAAGGQVICELRGDGSQTVFPPSVHPSGETIAWAANGKPSRVTRTELESALDDLVAAVRAIRGEQPENKPTPPDPTPRAASPAGTGNMARDRLRRRAEAYVNHARPSAEGGRNAATFSLAGNLAAMTQDGERLGEQEIVALLQSWNQRNAPPLDESELQTCVASALRNGTPRPEKTGQTQTTTPEPTIAPAYLPVRQIIADNPALRPPVIHGLLREGETMNIIAPPKAGKSWLAADLALALVTGRNWLDVFQTEPGHVLILDNELHRQTIANRIPKVANARGIAMDDFADGLFVDSLRGRLIDLTGLPRYFANVGAGDFKLVILDALYRFWPRETDENDNATIARCYNILDNLADRLGCAFVLIHHASKGGQASKSITDIGAGAGSQSRATDSHLVLRPHVEPDAIVLEAVVRSWPPVQPVCLRWNFPIWTPDQNLDPKALKPDRLAKQRKADAPAEQSEPHFTPDRFAVEFVTMTPQARDAIIYKATVGASKTIIRPAAYLPRLRLSGWFIAGNSRKTSVFIWPTDRN